MYPQSRAKLYVAFVFGKPPKRVLLQTVKIEMKYSIMLRAINNVKSKKYFGAFSFAVCSSPEESSKERVSRTR